MLLSVCPLSENLGQMGAGFGGGSDPSGRWFYAVYLRRCTPRRSAGAEFDADPRRCGLARGRLFCQSAIKRKGWPRGRDLYL